MCKIAVYWSLAFIPLIAGCQDDTASSRALTASNLKVLGDVVCLYSPDECLQVQGLEEFLEASISRGYLALEKSEYLKDSWGRQMKYEARRSGSHVLVSIRSSGSRGVFLEGNPDNIVIDVDFGPRGERRMTLTGR